MKGRVYKWKTVENISQRVELVQLHSLSMDTAILAPESLWNYGDLRGGKNTTAGKDLKVAKRGNEALSCSP